MKNLKDYIINEAASDDPKIGEIKDFLKTHYTGAYRISAKPDNDGLYIVNSSNQIYVKNTTGLTHLTNGLFKFGKVRGPFMCNNCPELVDLEGAPIEAQEFNCDSCPNLTSLKGAPEWVKFDFSCNNCPKLTSLEGAPKEVGNIFSCKACGKKFSKNNVLKVSSVGKSIVCDGIAI